jgi:lipopolysaccharide transport system ATP-binding protein
MAAVSLEDVSKKFTLHHDRPRSFQDAFISALRRDKSAREEFWALRDVSFQVAHGETLAFIGPNGAGKSTVLKLIARIIEPTSGCIKVNGRIGSLLELGAGFHPDLTGRENIYLNGSILGLSRSQIRQRLDEIIAFAELERFIDVPVKHYSSGMYVRLGFSMAVHVDPEILLVDEVLAVGDAAFQKKCLNRMARFKRQGCTILFVSHALQFVEQLCTKVIWLGEGRVQEVGDTARVIASYMGAVADKLETELSLSNAAGLVPKRHGKLVIRSVTMLDAEDKLCWAFRSGDLARIRIVYNATERVERPVFSVLIHRSDGLYVSSTNTYDINPLEVGPIDGPGELLVVISELDLYEGDYLLSAATYVEPDPPFWSTPADFLDKQYRFRMLSPAGRHGVIVLPAEWEHRPTVREGTL